jgi:hypothetical protein
LLRDHEFAELTKEIYAELGFTGVKAPDEEEIRTLLDYLHQSGAVYSPPRWRDQSRPLGVVPIIVDQRWAINGIYEVVRPGPIRDELKEKLGVVPLEYLKNRWNEMLDDFDEPAFDEVAQWVMCRFMESCGLLVQVGDDCILPELLPLRGTLEERSEHPLMKKAEAADRKSTWSMHDAALGPGFGCLLVGVLLKHFHKVPVFRFGAVFEVKVNRFDQDETDVLVRLEWLRQHKDNYNGDIVATIFGDSVAVDEVLAYLEDLIKAMPGCLQNGALRSYTHFHSNGRVSTARQSLDNPKTSVRAKPCYGIVGLSFAGDTDKPGIEFWPLELDRCLTAASGGSFHVMLYRSDVERKTVTELVGDLTKSDIMIAFIGKKYLKSEYCMVELLEAARYLQPHDTFDKPSAWPGKGKESADRGLR